MEDAVVLLFQELYKLAGKTSQPIVPLKFRFGSVEVPVLVELLAAVVAYTVFDQLELLPEPSNDDTL